MIKLVVFDLDDTLVDTSSFKSLRDNGKWNELTKHIDNFNEIGDSKNVIDLLRKNEIIVIIMTTSRTDYAEEVLNKFNINYDELFGYSELKKYYLKYTTSKTGAICKLKSEYDLSSNEILFVGDSYKDYKACEETNILFITAKNTEAFTSFDGKLISVNSYSDIFPILKEIQDISFGIINEQNERIGEFKTLAYYLTDSYVPISMSIYRNKEDYEDNEVENDEDDKEGTRFSYDAMHKRIKDVKNNKPKSIVNTIRALLEIRLKSHFAPIDYVVRALGSNELEYDKNNISAMDIICFFIASRLGAEYKPMMLKQSKTHDKFSHQKNLNYNARHELVSGTYSADEIDDNKNILLIDDVITTGATTEEILRAIKQSNSTVNVQLFSIAKSEKYTQKRYIQNITNATYFTCAHPNFNQQRKYQDILIKFLKKLLSSNKIITAKDGGYNKTLICSNDINILDKSKNYIFFSIRANKIITSKFSHFEEKNGSPLYPYNKEFIDNAIEKISRI